MFDLDPSEGAGFEEVIEVALLVKQTLDLLELESYPKTSGSRGIHVLVPIARRHTFEEVREFAGIVAGALARAHPGLATTEWAKQKRRGVLVDANQNGPGRTNAAVYSVRPRAGAPVSTPLRWEEVRAGLDPVAFTMDVVLDRVARDGDLFARRARRQAVAEGRAEVLALVAPSHAEPRDGRASRARRCRGGRRARPSSRRRRGASGDSNGSWYRWYVRATHQPRKPRSCEPGDLGDALVAPECRDLAEHAIAVRPRRTRQVLHEPACLPECVLAGGRIGDTRCPACSAPQRRHRAPRRSRGPRRATARRRARVHGRREEDRARRRADSRARPPSRRASAPESRVPSESTAA